MRHAQEIFDRLWVDARESDEDARVVFIVRGGVVDVRLFCDERVTVGEIAVDGERIGLCRLVYRDAGNLRPSTSSVSDRQAVPAVVLGSFSPISRTVSQVISFILVSQVALARSERLSAAALKHRSQPKNGAF